jgi:hypothetical protein
MCILDRTQGDMSSSEKPAKCVQYVHSLEGNLSACLCLCVSFSPRGGKFVKICFFNLINQSYKNSSKKLFQLCRHKIISFFYTIKVFPGKKPCTPRINEMTPAVRGRYLLYAFGWIYVRTTCRLGFCPVYTFNARNAHKQNICHKAA